MAMYVYRAKFISSGIPIVILHNVSEPSQMILGSLEVRGIKKIFLHNLAALISQSQFTIKMKLISSGTLRYFLHTSKTIKYLLKTRMMECGAAKIIKKRTFIVDITQILFYRKR